MLNWSAYALGFPELSAMSFQFYAGNEHFSIELKEEDTYHPRCHPQWCLFRIYVAMNTTMNSADLVANNLDQCVGTQKQQHRMLQTIQEKSPLLDLRHLWLCYICCNSATGK
ncbi:hypothetical protein CDAR_263571 [Caerostris darwini]|uniref:Uncharacterized protein n=1 Tax=Caerostris darwini TaxID=1538125 RepID=A0AAV4S0V0_9ARAC|nr:hypothetical protein CDAR_263571 [Caerostris darwini]